MKYRDDLKIELRAIPYASYSHVLEWRISPDQDLKYSEDEIEKSLFGLVKKLVNKFKEYDNLWHKPRLFADSLTMELHEFDHEFNWGPIWCENKQQLEYYKQKFKTYGDIRKYIEDHTDKSYKKWKAAREAYLNRRKTIY